MFTVKQKSAENFLQLETAQFYEVSVYIYLILFGTKLSTVTAVLITVPRYGSGLGQWCPLMPFSDARGHQWPSLEP